MPPRALRGLRARYLHWALTSSLQTVYLLPVAATKEDAEEVSVDAVTVLLLSIGPARRLQHWAVPYTAAAESPES